MKKRKGKYALYKGEELLSSGTISEIATELKITEKTVRYYLTKSWHERSKGKNHRTLIRIDQEGEVDEI